METGISGVSGSRGAAGDLNISAGGDAHQL